MEFAPTTASVRPLPTEHLPLFSSSWLAAKIPAITVHAHGIALLSSPTTTSVLFPSYAPRPSVPIKRKSISSLTSPNPPVWAITDTANDGNAPASLLRRAIDMGIRDLERFLEWKGEDAHESG